MKQSVNSVYRPLFLERGRYFILMGGRGAGRSTVASQLANTLLIGDGYFRCAIMRYILGDIRNSIYREITDRAEENGILDKLEVNDSTMTIRYGRNSINAVGFKKSSGDQKAKLKSLANYNYVIIEEADEIPEEDFMQLDDSLRTLKGDIKIILLLNPPPKNHWIIKRFFDLVPVKGLKGFYEPKVKPDLKDTVVIRSSYLDNKKNIAPDSIVRYEGYKLTKPNHYWNMIRGFVPETVVGRIYTNWTVVEDVPRTAKLVRHWLDFGYTNDPTSIGDVYKGDGGYYLDERLYATGMSNRDIGDFLLSLEKALTIADSSEPKSIDEIAGYGVPIIGATKGQGSVNQGIQVVQAAKIYITRRSVNTIKESENYAWKQDKEGNGLNVPKPGWDHSMDGVRYVIQELEENGPGSEASYQTGGVQPMFGEGVVFEPMGGVDPFAHDSNGERMGGLAGWGV